MMLSPSSNDDQKGYGIKYVPAVLVVEYDQMVIVEKRTPDYAVWKLSEKYNKSRSRIYRIIQIEREKL